MPTIIDRLRNVQNGDAATCSEAINLSDSDVRFLEHYLVSDLPRSNAGINCIQIVVRFLEHYFVSDLPRSNAGINCIQIVLVVESPHVYEICHKHPLAGNSGINVTKEYLPSQTHVSISDSSKPIGCLSVNGELTWLSLMNVSQLPLQEKVYCVTRPDHSDDLKRLLKTLVEIKRKLDRTKEGNDCHFTGLSSSIYNIIIEDLKDRIAQVRCRWNPMFVPCGKISRVFLQQIEEDICIYQEDVPHPALYQRQDGYQDALGALAHAIRLRIQ